MHDMDAVPDDRAGPLVPVPARRVRALEGRLPRGRRVDVRPIPRRRPLPGIPRQLGGVMTTDRSVLLRQAAAEADTLLGELVYASRQYRQAKRRSAERTHAYRGHGILTEI